ncbi:hypothetical protein PISL3812_06195 [Talaromyces islandicus]|uniref:Uncharacterized protein n=1 Tax=Talaromyces islandicus TaxID=28573 RepID=A0A0U1M0V5_TALIS|nr:hypothetical protein PISL3812_06195 [Talaromyces islandicus]
MSRHKSEVHELLNSPSNARPAKLQTFFRGTKLRYFEVTCSTGVDENRRSPTATFDAISVNYQSQDKELTRPLSQVNTAAILHFPPLPSPGSTLHNFDLETLAYFHQFITKTSLTLPASEGPEFRGSYWQANIVVLALESRWLMCGLLAISASHSAFLSIENSTEEAHRKRYVQFLAEFSTGWGNMTTLIETNVQKETVEAAMKPGATFDLGYFMQAVPKFLVSHPVVHPSEAQSESKIIQDDSFDRATRIFKMRKPGRHGNIGIVSICDDQPSAMYGHLRSLPTRMAEVFGKPESVHDVLAAISAIAHGDAWRDGWSEFQITLTTWFRKAVLCLS